MMKSLRWLMVLLMAAGVSAKDVQVVELTNFSSRTFAEEGIFVQRAMDVKIEAWGVSNKWEDEMLAYGWIVESATRLIVWKLTPDNSEEWGERNNRKVEKTIRLPRGSYEIYFTVAPRGSWHVNYRGVGDFLDDLFSGFRGGRDRRDARKWGITLSVDEENGDAIEKISVLESENPGIQMISMGENEFESYSFSLKEDTRFRIYAIGEGDDGEMFDYGWIVDGETRETVWEMDYRDTDHAGGAQKNRIIDEEMVLPSGHYIVYYVTDGSHSFEKWNMLPPFDPRYWGITLWGIEQGFQMEDVVTPYEPELGKNRIVDITRMGNGRFEVERFRLNQPAKVRILCLGEYGYNKNFVDHGWIMEANTRRIVWKFTYRDTRHAGGGSKNRMFDGIIDLDAGNYEVYYKTDGSHAYRHWNVGPPYDPESWGISLWGAGENFQSDWISSYRVEDDPDLLAQIIRVRDSERAKKKFILDESTKVRIYAVGEGDDDEMSDYGWIEDEDGHKVWRMTYWDTEHAGGAKKNRIINEVIQLEAGHYSVFYRSDGSHSYDDWNSSPPSDAEYWGITVRREE
jgi:hypothetical protein